MLAEAGARAAEAVRDGEDPAKGRALPRGPQLLFLPGPWSWGRGDGAGPDDHAGGVIFSSIQWLFENSLR